MILIGCFRTWKSISTTILTPLSVEDDMVINIVSIVKRLKNDKNIPVGSKIANPLLEKGKDDFRQK